MQKEKWYTLTQASLKMNKSSSYLSTWFERHREKPPDDLLMKTSAATFITDEGIQWVKDHTKKEGVRLRTNILKRTTKQRT